VWCPSCAAEYRPGFTECPDCIVPLVAKRPAASAPTDDHQWYFEYDVSDWSDDDRQTLQFWLVVSQVPVEWADDRLVVPIARAQDVDSIIDAIESGESVPRDTIVDLASDAVHGERATPVGRRADTRELANPARRLVAFLIDAAIVGIVASALFQIVGGPNVAVSATVLVLHIGYVTGTIARWGCTIGMLIVDTRVMRSRVVPPGLRVSAIRAAVAFAAAPLTLVGWVGASIALCWQLIVFAPILGPQRRGIHDRVAHTDVVVSA